MIPKLVSPDLFLVPVAVLWMMEAGCLGRGMQSSANSVMSIVWSFCPSLAQPEFSGHCVQPTLLMLKRYWN